MIFVLVGAGLRPAPTHAARRSKCVYNHGAPHLISGTNPLSQKTGLANQDVRAVHAGSTAIKLLAYDRPAAVLGVTSRGIFIRLADEWVIFLSYESWRGPLTVNLDGSLSGVQAGAPARLRDGILSFSSGWAVTGLETALRWDAPAAPGLWLPAAARRQNLSETAMLVLAGGERGFSGLLAQMLGLPAAAATDARLASLVFALPAALRAGDWTAALPPAVGLLGLGSGLTPSGDDLLIGLLLGLRRLSGSERSGTGSSALISFGEAVAAQARRRTTSLSACLLACAAQGQADERLVTALDGMIAGTLTPDASAGLLLDWGSSSGCDALVGMTLAILIDETS
jgi:hypothetical protein